MRHRVAIAGLFQIFADQPAYRLERQLPGFGAVAAADDVDAKAGADRIGAQGIGGQFEQRLFELATDALVVCAVDGAILRANGAAARLVLYGPDRWND